MHNVPKSLTLVQRYRQFLTETFHVRAVPCGDGYQFPLSFSDGDTALVYSALDTDCRPMFASRDRTESEIVARLNERLQGGAHE